MSNESVSVYRFNIEFNIAIFQVGFYDWTANWDIPIKGFKLSIENWLITYDHLNLNQTAT